MTDTPPPIPSDRFRRGVVVVASLTTLFWLYTFFHIARAANPKGDGMEWLAAVPMTLIFGVLVLPPLIAALAARRFPLIVKIAAVVLAFGIIADAVVWAQILGEFAGKAAR